MMDESLTNQQGKSTTSRGTGHDDLTNLNWVAGIPVPMSMSVSPPEGTRVRKLFFGPRNGQVTDPEGDDNSVFSTPIRIKSLKTPLPTYKIVVKDQNEKNTNYNCLSPEKRNSVILANVVPSYNEDYSENSLSCELSLDDDGLCVAETPKISSTVAADEENDEDDEDEAVQEKPNCSYTCLVGMALKASSGCLPVNAIYLYIEREFPYFLNAPDGWKNSVRHNLSLNPIFCKVNRDGWTGKKGYLWKVCPDKQELVDKEIFRFLHSTGKKLNKFTIPLKGISKYKQRSKKINRLRPLSSTPVVCSRCTRILSPVPHESSTSSEDSTAQVATAEEIKTYSSEMQEEIALSDLQVKSKVSATQSAFDTNKPPSKYVGVKSPSNDPDQIARELFGPAIASSSYPNAFYPPLSYGGAFVPIYPQHTPYGIPFDLDKSICNSSSGSSNAASPVSGMASQYVPHYPQYTVPVPIRYVFSGQYPSMYNLNSSNPGGGADASSETQQSTKEVVQSQTEAPLCSVRVLSSSGKMEREDTLMSSCDNKEMTVKQGKHQLHSCGTDSSVSDLNSPLKRMKVMDSSFQERAGNESASAYYADVSANITYSDGEVESNEVVSNIMSLLSKPNQHHFSSISDQEKRNLEEIVGKSGLSELLSEKFDSIASKENTRLGEIPQEQVDSDSKSITPSPPPQNGDPDDFDVDLRFYSTQKNNSNCYLPSLNCLLNMGDDTIVTIKAAMNLEIQGIVEVATEDHHDHCDLEKESPQSKIHI